MSADDSLPARRKRQSAPRADLPDVAEAEVTPSVAATERQRSQGLTRALARLRLLQTTILAVGAALHLSQDDLAASEAFDRVERLATLTVEQAAAISEAETRRWFETLGDDLAIDLALEGLDPTLEPVRAELRAADDDPVGGLVAFQRSAQAVAETQGESVHVSAQLGIGKAQAQRLAEQALAERRATHTAARSPQRRRWSSIARRPARER